MNTKIITLDNAVAGYYIEIEVDYGYESKACFYIGPYETESEAQTKIDADETGALIHISEDTTK